MLNTLETFAVVVEEGKSLLMFALSKFSEGWGAERRGEADTHH